MGIVVSRRKGKVKVYWNGEAEVVEVRKRKGRYEFILRNGGVVVSNNRHLYEVVRRRLRGGR